MDVFGCGLVGPGLVRDGRVCGEDGVGEGQFVVGGGVEAEAVFDDPGQVLISASYPVSSINVRRRVVRVSSRSSTLPPGRIQ